MNQTTNELFRQWVETETELKRIEKELKDRINDDGILKHFVSIDWAKVRREFNQS